MQGFLDGHIRVVDQILQLDFCGDCALIEDLQLNCLTNYANQTVMKTVLLISLCERLWQYCRLVLHLSDASKHVSQQSVCT